MAGEGEAAVLLSDLGGARLRESSGRGAEEVVHDGGVALGMSAAMLW